MIIPIGSHFTLRYNPIDDVANLILHFAFDDNHLTEEVMPTLLLDRNADDKVVGIEFLNASKQLPKLILDDARLYWTAAVAIVQGARPEGAKVEVLDPKNENEAKFLQLALADWTLTVYPTGSGLCTGHTILKNTAGVWEWDGLSLRAWGDIQTLLSRKESST